jgi:hypothetical protein
MSSEPAGAGSAEPAAIPRRFSLKLTIVVGATTLLLVALVTAGALWLWPKSVDLVEAKAA